MSSLDSREKLLLLRIARRAMITAVERIQSGESLSNDLDEKSCAGAFVTLWLRGRLRGCIGQIGLTQPVAEVVSGCAKSAALEDPRFDPVRPDEVADIDIELSVLSPAVPIAIDQIEAGKHGLIVSNGWRRGVLLPQVATEYGWQSLRFLEETCAKAGLERNAWQDPETRILAFTADVFSELDVSRSAENESSAAEKSGYSTST
jgi:uncharacterized protein